MSRIVCAVATAGEREKKARRIPLKWRSVEECLLIWWGIRLARLRAKEEDDE